jgi:peptide methionine sulfoxide reductase msrA/msrB
MQFLMKAVLVTLALIAFAGCSNETTPAQSQLLMSSDMKTTRSDTIVLGLGCFWGAEKKFAALPGVIDVMSGYADGRGFQPNYQEIIKRKHKFNENNYAEVIQVTYNPDQISLTSLYQTFFELHDPTQGYRQGNDVGTQYRSTILTKNSEQTSLANDIAAQYQALLSAQGFGEITTKIKKLDEFHPAEDYHQDYLVKNPNGYCPDHSTGVVFNQKEAKAEELVDNSDILQGKHIVVIDSEFCPYCDKFKQDVANDYGGTVPMHFRRASQLHGLTVTSPTWATPTLLFMEAGVEKFAIQGYVNNKDFYKALGYFKLGDSEAFNVAFNEGTDGRFCKQYEIFKNTPDGVFIDKLSGVALFDTKDRFNSGSGWLSFTKAIDNSVYYKQDNRYGMQRTEVRAKNSDIHLGHVFNDGPNGQPRYCINATVLEFKARADI